MLLQEGLVVWGWLQGPKRQRASELNAHSGSVSRSTFKTRRTLGWRKARLRPGSYT